MSGPLRFRPTNGSIIIAVSMFKTNKRSAVNTYGKMDTWITTDVNNMSRLFQDYKFDGNNGY